MVQAHRVIGLMSGTSMDGVDVAAIETDGEGVSWTGPSVTVPYAPALRARLDRAVRDPAAADDLGALVVDLTDAHAAALPLAHLRCLPCRSHVRPPGAHAAPLTVLPGQ